MWQEKHARKGEAQGVLSYQEVKGIFDNPQIHIYSQPFESWITQVPTDGYRISDDLKSDAAHPYNKSTNITPFRTGGAELLLMSAIVGCLAVRIPRVPDVAFGPGREGMTPRWQCGDMRSYMIWYYISIFINHYRVYYYVLNTYYTNSVIMSASVCAYIHYIYMYILKRVRYTIVTCRHTMIYHFQLPCFLLITKALQLPSNFRRYVWLCSPGDPFGAGAQE